VSTKNVSIPLWDAGDLSTSSQEKRVARFICPLPPIPELPLPRKIKIAQIQNQQDPVVSLIWRFRDEYFM
jgi:hypothetical protein